MPVHPEWHSDEFRRLLKRTGLHRLTLHSSRHTTLTLMEHAGAPISIVRRQAPDNAIGPRLARMIRP